MMEKYNRLRIISVSHRDSRSRLYVKCQCECSNIVILRLDCVKSGNNKSCGCWLRENKKNLAHRTLVKHGSSKTRLYRIWLGLRERCEKSYSESFKNYGGRGITVCSDWAQFEPFRDWAISAGYNDSLTIDRNNVNGPYSPDNCCWKSLQEQQRNRRNTIKLTYRGVTKTLSEWAGDVSAKYHTLYRRYTLNSDPAHVLRGYVS